MTYENNSIIFSLSTYIVRIIVSCVGILSPDLISMKTELEGPSYGQDVIICFITPCLIVTTFLAYKITCQQ